MHIVVGNVSAHYSGRGVTELTPYDRIVMVKADGTVSIHGDKGFKPMNYMATSAKLEESIEDNCRIWTFTTKQEKLVIRFHEIYDEINLSLGESDPGHSHREGTEPQLQKWLSRHLTELAPELFFEDREHQTGAGPVDILASKDEDTLVAVEVKRSAPMNTVGQVLRYVDALEELYPNKKIFGVIAAVEFKESTFKIAHKKNVTCLKVPENWYESFTKEEALIIEAAPKTLFD